MSDIPEILEAAFKRMENTPLMTTCVENVPPEMIDNEIEIEDEGYIGWKLIPSKVSDEDIENLENLLKIELPFSFKEYLQYKHFYEIMLQNYHIRMPAHPMIGWEEVYKERAFDGWEGLNEKGLLWIADWEDWGLLCFDTKIKKQNNEYPVVLIWHDDLENIETKYNNFTEMLASKAPEVMD